MIQSFISLKFSEFIFQSSFARVESWGAATEFLWSVSKLLVFLLSTSNFINNVRKKAVPIERLSKCLVLVDMSRNIHHTSPSLSGKAFPAKSCEFREKKERGNISCLRFSHWLQLVCVFILTLIWYSSEEFVPLDSHVVDFLKWKSVPNRKADEKWRVAWCLIDCPDEGLMFQI